MLKEQIQSDVTNAMKDGNQEVVAVLRLALTAIQTKEKDKRYAALKGNQNVAEGDIDKASVLGDDEIIDALSSEIKKRKDAVALYVKGNRPELAQKEEKEIEILKKYLPDQLSADELQKMIEEAIGSTGAKEIKDMGKVMANLAPKIKGRADSGEVGAIVKKILSK